MRILFVWPNQGEFSFKPIGISLLSAILKSKGHDVDLFDTTFMDFGYKSHLEIGNKTKLFKEVDFSRYDVAAKKVNLKEELSEKIKEFKPDIVGISALSDEKLIGIEISRIIKKLNDRIIVIWGSKAATVNPQKILECPEVDFLCIGEGVDFFPEFVECVSQKGNPKKIRNLAYRDDKGIFHSNPLRPYYQNLASLPFLDWSIFDKRHFLKALDSRIYRSGEHMITWGCPNPCTYCINTFYRSLYGQKAGHFLRHYSVDRIIKELKYLVDRWNLGFLKFTDNDFCLKTSSYLRELSGKYKQDIGVPFAIASNAKNINREKVVLLKKMNCANITLGIDAGNDRLRKEVLRRVETKKEIIEASKMLNDAGIRTSSFNMMGVPFENRKTIMETIELNKKANIRYPNVFFFFPYEKTQLREIAIQSGFLNNNFDDIRFQDKPTLNLDSISTEELIALRERFVLYIKMPYIFYKYIELSENNGQTGARLTEELYKIYDECVFANDGIWNDRGKQAEYLKKLGEIIKDD